MINLDLSMMTIELTIIMLTMSLIIVTFTFPNDFKHSHHHHAQNKCDILIINIFIPLYFLKLINHQMGKMLKNEYEYHGNTFIEFQ